MLDSQYKTLDSISHFKYNWDGYGAKPIPTQTISNSQLLLLNIYMKLNLGFPMQRDLQIDITPTSYGTIVIDFENQNGLVSIEVSETKIGFFSEYKNENWKNVLFEEGQMNFNTIPPLLKKTLKHLLYGKGFKGFWNEYAVSNLRSLWYFICPSIMLKDNDLF